MELEGNFGAVHFGGVSIADGFVLSYQWALTLCEGLRVPHGKGSWFPVEYRPRDVDRGLHLGAGLSFRAKQKKSLVDLHFTAALSGGQPTAAAGH